MTKSAKLPLALKNAPTKKHKLLSHSQLFGTWGETIARDFLVAKGYRCLWRNLRLGKSELDLVMLDSQSHELVVVEVKARGQSSMLAGHPSLAVKGRKWLALERAGARLLSSQPAAKGLRFDVVTVSPMGVEHFVSVTWP